MDTRDGRIYTPEEMKEMFGKIREVEGAFYEKLKQPWKKTTERDDLGFFKPMEVSPTEKQLARKPPKVGRNETCPCGSGKKFKACCLIANWKERFNK